MAGLTIGLKPVFWVLVPVRYSFSSLPHPCEMLSYMSVKFSNLIEKIDKLVMDRVDPSEIKPLISTLSEYVEALKRDHAKLKRENAALIKTNTELIKEKAKADDELAKLKSPDTQTLPRIIPSVEPRHEFL